MRIGMVLDKTFPPDPRVENEAISLVNAGHQVFLFCLKYNNEINDDSSNGIQIKRYKSNKLEYKLSALVYTVPLYTLIMAKKIKHFLINNAIETIHVHDIRIAQATLNANEQKLPVILDLHDNMPEIIKFYPHLQKFPGKYLISPKKWKRKEEEFIKNAKRVITVSAEFKSEVMNRTKIDENKISVVPNTVRQSFYKEYEVDNKICDMYKNEFVVLYLGDTGLRRGLKTAIEAISLLKTNMPRIRLVIVGENTTDTVLKALVKEQKLEAFVDFQGWQDVKLFPSYILASSVCISPLYRNIQHDVAYANKLFQYMSFAKPIIASNATAQKNLITSKKCGLIHEEKNAHDLADKIFKLYQNEQLREELGYNGKRFIENEFNWEMTSKSLLDLYDSLVI
ncbi:MAG: glycosyltransferase family 4 protein [Flavobacteriaceae bacterium]|nr:glycosyltransferase family 4 protein [Flavobacteriaceae bacterium]